MLKEENEKLKNDVIELRACLEKFTNGSKYLDMITRDQRAVYNKAGIGYRPKEKEVAYMSLINGTRNDALRNKVTKNLKGKVKQVWVSKKYLNDISESSAWVPKSCVFYVS